MELQIGDAEPVALSELGITGARLTMAASAMDVLELSTDEHLKAKEIIGPFNRVILTVDKKPRFIGWCDTAPRDASGGQHGRVYTLHGGWRWLDRKIYQQDALVGGNVAPSGSVMLNRGLEPDTKVSAGNQIADILAFAHGGSSAWSYSPPPGGIASLSVPNLPRMNATCGSAMRAVMEWLPAIAMRWSYATDTPSLEFVDVDATPVRGITHLNTDLSKVTLNPRYELLCDEVELIYLVLWTLRDSDMGSFKSRYVDSAGPSGDAAAFGAARKFSFTVELEQNEPPPNGGLAAEYLRWVGRLQVDSTIESDGDLRWDWSCGDRLHFGGVLSEWSDYSSVIQVITRDLFRDKLTLQVGSRGHLGLDQMLELARKKASGMGGGGGGWASETDDDEGEKATITVTIDPGLAVEMGTLWAVNGSGWQPSGAQVEVELGDYSVEFKCPQGVVQIEPQAVQVLEKVDYPISVTAQFRYIDLSGAEIVGGDALSRIGSVDYREMEILKSGQVYRSVALRASDISSSGSVGSPRPFSCVYDETEGKFLVLPSTLGGIPPDGMTWGSAPFYLAPTGATGVIYGILTYSAGVPTSAALGAAASMPSPTADTTAVVTIAGWFTNSSGKIVAANARYGPIDAQICRNWFAASSPYWGVTFIGS